MTLSTCRLLQRSVVAPKGLYTSETNNSSMGIFQFLRQTDLRLALFVCVSLHLSQQLSGMVAIFYYSTSFFQSAGLDESTRYTNTQLSKSQCDLDLDWAPKSLGQVFPTLLFHHRISIIIFHHCSAVVVASYQNLHRSHPS